IIKELFVAFDRASIPAIGLKDVQLAQDVYPDSGFRPMGDIDILIHKQDYQKAAYCMAQLGYEPLPCSHPTFILKYGWSHLFHRASDNSWVDLQWNICQIEWDVSQEGNFDFEINRVWRNAVPMIIDEQQVMVPNPEDMFFHLCVHLEGHGYGELILFCDIVELLRHDDHPLDWAYIVDLARKHKVEGTIYYVLYLVNRLFRVPVPASVLNDLNPGYFKANLFGALFGNLTRLHMLLDDIHRATVPPNNVMRDFEAITRQQATSAMQIFREIDQLVSAFQAQNQHLIILNGTPSEKIFPVPKLNPFAEIRLFILEQDVPAMQAALSNCQFQTAGSPDQPQYSKEWALITRDPALANHPARVRMQIAFRQPNADLFQPPMHTSASTRTIALDLIRSGVARNGQSATTITVPLTIVPLSPEDMVCYFSAQLGRKQQNRLFELVNVLEVFRQAADLALDWSQVITQADRAGISAAVQQGLLAAGEVLAADQLTSPALNTWLQASAPPRILAWARYGPDSFETRTSSFRGLFFYMITLLSITGIVAKFRYVLRSLFWPQNKRWILPALVLQGVKGWLMFSNKNITSEDIVFWIDPESRLETEVETN
ncbi:MAG: nucleotidyltransferase family protein, partial [Anaerolineae bacterium]|nr:nucleotidyltransferase family protein [Anaerolineae bacterium]